MKTKTYSIIRYYMNAARYPKTIKTGLTLAAARKHCARNDMHEVGVWFDGYTEE